MIKIAIIIILVILLAITLYSYYCLSSRMIEFERSRLEFILNKEIATNEQEKKIKIISDCSNKNEQYQLAIKNINSVIGSLNLSPGSICQTEDYADILKKDKLLINEIKGLVTGEIDPESCTNPNNEPVISNPINPTIIPTPTPNLPIPQPNSEQNIYSEQDIFI
jgi:hypothetical protein